MKKVLAGIVLGILFVLGGGLVANADVQDPPIVIEWSPWNPVDAGIDPCLYDSGATFTVPQSEGYLYTVHHDEVGNTGQTIATAAEGYKLFGDRGPFYFEFYCVEPEPVAPAPAPVAPAPADPVVVEPVPDITELAITGPREERRAWLVAGGIVAILAGLGSVLWARRRHT